MLFAIMAEDVENSLTRRLASRSAHLARLETLQTEGRLILAGPHPLSAGQDGFSGSLIIAEFESLAAAEAWAQDDPYFSAGVYTSVNVKPFKQVFPK